LSLAGALEFAAKNNPLVLGAAADLAAAREAAGGARSRRLPSLSANGFATVGSYGSIYPSAPRVDPTYSLLAPKGGLLDANLMLMWPLLTGGLIEAMVVSAGGLEAAAGYDLQDARADAALGVEDAYFRALLAAENATAEEGRVEASADMVNRTILLAEAGKGIEASVRRAQAELAQARRSLATARGERAKALLGLKSTLGIDLDSEITLSDPLPDTQAAKPVAVYAQSADKARGMVLAARARLGAAEADVRAAEGSQRPQLYGVAMADAATQTGSRGASVGLVLSVPVFDGGGRRAETARVRAMRDRAAANVRQAELNAQREVRQAYVDRTTADENVRSAQASVEGAKASYEVVALRVANGKGILVEQLDALQALRRARADFAQARYDRAIAEARLRRAAGLPLVQEGSK